MRTQLDYHDQQSIFTLRHQDYIYQFDLWRKSSHQEKVNQFWSLSYAHRIDHTIRVNEFNDYCGILILFFCSHIPSTSQNKFIFSTKPIQLTEYNKYLMILKLKWFACHFTCNKGVVLLTMKAYL